ncbi:TetR/AcrR family transcriptional regulator [Dermatobacter hominis]|uniref:TetR/AcrR family transcriptional regulator n=1 Tax=Dermatobacter hominis TaxID=2884263 RepID=UPI001D104429|nr:TetR/AcrR family transcriptional regulator [Dermatobacter hominis]UDY35631.1 TetR/AcrR family transcriptional regulator [Dermatobacter hominis]
MSPTSTGRATAATDGPTRPAGPGRPRDPQVDQAILSAAVELLSDGGVEAMSVEAVALRAGVSRASVYRRYANRVDLMEAAFHAASAQKPEPPDTGSVRTDLIQLVLRLKSVLLDSDSGAMLPAMLSAARENPEVREALERFTSARRSPTVQVIRRGVERGEIRADVEPELLADMLVGAVIYRLLMRNGTIGDRRAEELVDLVLGGAGS